MDRNSKDSPSPTNYIGTQQFAALVGLSTKHVERLARAGKLPGAFRIGERGNWRIPEDALTREAAA